MKKHILARAVAIALTSSAVPAFSQSYFSADFLNVQAPGSVMQGLDAGMGYRSGSHLTIEGGYEGAYQSKVSFNGGYLDATTFIPLGATGFEAFVSGGGVARSGETPIHNGFIARWDTGLLGQAGIDYQFSPLWTIRAAYRYETAVVHTETELIGLTFGF